LSGNDLTDHQSTNLAALIGVYCFTGMCEYELKAEIGEIYNINEGEIIYDEVESN